MANPEGKMTSFISELESRIAARAELLEELHLYAAIDAQLTNIPWGSGTGKTNANPIIAATTTQSEEVEDVIFDDYINPNSVRNCFSPFVPSSSDRIKAFIDCTRLKSNDVVLDIGCGDGRICIAVTKLIGCRSIGIDVSPPCIAMARSIAQEENLHDAKCRFIEMDATIDPDILLAESSPVSALLKSATVIFLYIYPDLLVKLLPLLSRLTATGSATARLIATLTYHISERNAVLEHVDTGHDMKLYSKVVL